MKIFPAIFLGQEDGQSDAHENHQKADRRIEEVVGEVEGARIAIEADGQIDVGEVNDRRADALLRRIIEPYEPGTPAMFRFAKSFH